MTLGKIIFASRVGGYSRPPGLPQALKHVSMVFGPHSRHALPDIQLECGRRNREGLLQRLPCFLDPTGLA